jgi:hypothetical protein
MTDDIKQKGNPEEQGEPQGEPEPQEKPTETYSKEELDKILNKKIEEMKAKADAEQKQAEELAKLDGADKVKRELEIKREAFEIERKQFELEKTELEITKQLAEKGLPIRFAKMLIGKTAEESFGNVDILKKEWQEALEGAVREKLKGSPLEGGTQDKKDETGSIGSRLAKAKAESGISPENNPYF